MGDENVTLALTAVTIDGAKSAKTWSIRTPARWYLYGTLLEGLAQGLRNVAVELREFIQPEHPLVCPRHVAAHRHPPEMRNY
jgi:hypothetical protein